MASLHSGDIASSLWVCRIKGPNAHRSPLKGVCLALHRLCSRTQVQRAHGLDNKLQDSMFFCETSQTIQSATSHCDLDIYF